MIELYLSSDGKHTVHVLADTPEDLAELAPKAKALYEKMIGSYANKAQMWQPAIDQQPARLNSAKEIRARTVTRSGGAPICPVHDRPMQLRRGMYGTCWSCSVRSPAGGWCSFTKEANSDGEKKTSA